MEDKLYSNIENQEPTLREQVDKYARYWPWFLIFVLFTVGLSLVYLRYATPIYQTTATILIKDEKNSALSELAAFQDLGFTGSLNQSGFENEMIILKSKSLTERVVRNLDLNIRYFKEGKFKNAEIFGEVPFRVTILTSEDSLRFPAVPFYISVLSEQKFELWEEEGTPSEYNFGDPISLSLGQVTVTPNIEQLKRYLVNQTDASTIQVQIGSVAQTVNQFRQSIQIEQLANMSSVIQLSLKAPNSRKARVILDELIMQYNLDAKEDRNMVSQNTAEFINARLGIITNELDSVETGKVEFKEENKLTDIAVEGQLFLQNESEFNKRQLEVDMQLELVETMIESLKGGSESDLLPTNLGVEKEGVSAAINTYNTLVLERNRLLGSSTEQNPSVINLNHQINSVKNTILGGLENARTSLEIARNDLNAQASVVGSKISSIPSKEKAFRSITRQQTIKESLYLYLLQKREENAISLAVTTPKAKVVDYAFSSGMPVSPKRNIVLLGAVLIGLLIPFTFIYLRDLLDNKVRDRSDIEKVTKAVPIIGEIPQLDRNETGVIEKNDRSILAESFRILRTNLEYQLMGHPDIDHTKGKTIFVTSTVKGEGKTLVSYNLALTLANSGAKVALVGGDIRNPKVHRYLESGASNKGIVDYLLHPETTIADYLNPESENLSILFSGPIPPNPAELWMRPRAKNLFDELKEAFEYVIVDTAPCLLVTDTFLINKYADATLYVVRAGQTEKNLLKFPLDSINDQKLKNVAFVLNDVNDLNFGYGNKYSYGYVENQNTLWQQIKKAF